METKSCIETRRSVRRFIDKRVDTMDIERMVACAQLAPSWKNSQTTRFTAITDSDILAQVCATLGDWNRPIVKSAPLLFIVSAVKKKSGHDASGAPTTPYGEGYTFFDCGCAVENLCLAANDMGLGTVILGMFDPAKLKSIARVPENEDVMVLIACGWPEKGQTTGAVRMDMGEVLRRI